MAPGNIGKPGQHKERRFSDDYCLPKCVWVLCGDNEVIKEAIHFCLDCVGTIPE